MSTTVYNVDCMEYMRTVPDKFFDLAIVDPPYGGGSRERERERETGCTAELQTLKAGSVPGSEGGLTSTISASRTGGTWAAKYSHQGGVFSEGLPAPEIKAHRASDMGGRHRSYKKETGGADIRHWDIAPNAEYFRELARVSRNQIIWGANYFNMPPTRCFVVWRKLSISENFTMAMAEYAWTSFNDNAKVFEHTPQGTQAEPRIHPTQKPVALYKWLLARFAKSGQKILDTHVGSGSSRIACDEMGFDFVGCEIDKVYFDLQEKRFADWKKGAGSQLQFDF